METEKKANEKNTLITAGASLIKFARTLDERELGYTTSISSVVTPKHGQQTACCAAKSLK